MDGMVPGGARWRHDGAPAPAPERCEQVVAGMEIALDASPRSVPQARRWLLDALGPAARYDADVATLLLSELVTNALLHARTSTTVRVADDGSRLRVEVSDSGRTAAHPFPRPVAGPPEEHGENGRGLQIVALLATRWGVQQNGHGVPGRTVWFELAPVAGELAAEDDVSA